MDHITHWSIFIMTVDVKAFSHEIAIRASDYDSIPDVQELAKSLRCAKWRASDKTWRAPNTHAVRTALCDLRADRPQRFGIFDGVTAGRDWPTIDMTALSEGMWAHQIDGVKFLDDTQSGVLNFDMGTGKTRTTIEWLRLSAQKNVLVVCPKSVMKIWSDEIRKFGDQDMVDRTVCVTTGAAAKKAKSIIPGQITIINYESVWRGAVGTAIAGIAWDCIICDEIHRIKSSQSKCAKFMAGLRNQNAPHVRCVGMTGTLMADKPLDVFGAIRFIDPGILGDRWWDFRHRYARWGGHGNHQIMGYQRADELRSRTERVTIRVMADDVLDLPDKTEQDIAVQMSAKARKITEDLRRDFVSHFGGDGTVTAANALVRLLRFSQITSGFVRDETGVDADVCDAKQAALTELFDSIPTGEPVIVFCRFLKNIDHIAAVAKKLGRECLQRSSRADGLDLWQAMSGGEVLACQIGSGGVGVDLTRARYCIYYSVGYSLAEYEQSKARIYRAGQMRTCHYYHILTQDSIDVVIQRMLRQKTIDIEGIMQYMKIKGGKI